MKLLDERARHTLADLLRAVPIPRIVSARQVFASHALPDVYQAVSQAVESKLERARPGMRVAVAVGSRGIANLPIVVRASVDRLKAYELDPFVVPAMGSHGGATAEGQREVLESLGVTEAQVGAPIRASMEVVQLGELPNGLPIYLDRLAFEADGIVVINRIKPHTAFHGPYESGLLKMITIGLGKQKGAESCHAYGFKVMAENIEAMSRVSLSKANVLFGVALLEDAHDHTAKVVCLGPEEILAQEPILLDEARSLMPKILVDPIDVLVIDEIGKDISGDGMDPNITGRYPTPYARGGPEVSKMVVLRLTERARGNANGLGTADFTTESCLSQVDLMKAYVNGLTSTVVGPTKIPMPLPSDRLAVQAAIKTSNCRNLSKLRLVRIRNTLKLSIIYISETMLDEARNTPGIEVAGEPMEWPFDPSGNLRDLWSP